MTALNTPTIWTPRSGPWWRLPRWADIAQYAKKLQFKDGKLAIKNGKPIITEEGNPCCCGVPCGDCDATPRRYLVTFEDVVACNYCYRYSLDNQPAMYVEAQTWGGTFELTQSTAEPCVWLYEEFPSSFLCYMPDSSNCNTKVRDIILRIELIRSIHPATLDPEWTLRTSLQPPPPFSFFATMRTFQNVVVRQSCLGSFDLVNGYTSCPTPNAFGLVFITQGNAAYDGTATVTAL